MKTPPFSIANPRTGRTLATAARIANNFFTRFRGLMWTNELPAGEGLLIVPCNSVHCIGMRYAIDVLFLSKTGEVLRLIPDMAPGRLSPIVRGARAVLELPAGTAKASGTEVGDTLAIGTKF